MKLKKKVKRKRYQEMTAEELAAATKEFDRPETTPPTVKPPAKERQAMERIFKRGRGRPKLGERGAARVLITIDPSLLAQADRAAELEDVSRSQFIAGALRERLTDCGRRGAKAVGRRGAA